jgi:two-component system, OmpR family, sensor histidine kinase CiaH
MLEGAGEAGGSVGKGVPVSAAVAGIHWRLVAWTMLVLGLILVALGTAVYVALEQALLAAVDRNLAGRAEQAATSGALRAGDAGSQGAGERRDREYREGYRGGVFYLVLGADGGVLANPQRVDAAGVAFPTPAAGAGARPGRRERERAYATVVLDDEPVRVYARPLREGEAPGARLVVGQSLEPEQEALESLVQVLVGGGVAGLLLSLAGAWFLAGRALVPIEQAFLRQQAFVADAAHELRTPLTVLRSATDLLDRHRDEPLAANGDLLDDARHEVGRLERLAGDLLTLARSDRDGLELAVAPLDLGALAAAVVRRAEPLAQSRGVALGFRGEAPPPVVEADPDRLEQVLLILLDNALRYTPTGGRVDVRVRREGDGAAVEVADTGIGISAQHLPRVFERFYRADPARTRRDGGAGLGLPIARTVVEAHGGRLTLDSTPGAGTRAVVSLPGAPPARAPSGPFGREARAPPA